MTMKKGFGLPSGQKNTSPHFYLFFFYMYINSKQIDLDEPGYSAFKADLRR